VLTCPDGHQQRPKALGDSCGREVLVHQSRDRFRRTRRPATRPSRDSIQVKRRHPSPVSSTCLPRR
jgi:hypothetical protein